MTRHQLLQLVFPLIVVAIILFPGLYFPFPL